MKKYTEQFTKMNHADLEKKAKEMRSEIVDLKRGIKLGDVENSQIAKKNRRDLARILTILARPEEESKDKATKAIKKENK